MSFSNEKSISLDWNGTQFILTARPETGLGFDYATSIDGITWTSYASDVDALTTHSLYQSKWTGQAFQFGGNLVTPDNRSVLGHTHESAENRLLIPPTASSIPFYPVSDVEINTERPHTLTFPRQMSLVFGAGEPNGKNIAYSYTDGQQWQTTDCPLNTAAFAGDWNGHHWMAVGSGTHHTIAFSRDGIQWKGRGKSIFTEEGRAIRWSAPDKVWVAGGRGQYALAYSHDGIFWTGIESVGNMTECYTLAYHNHLWIAGGLGGMAYSRNGTQWSPVMDGFDHTCRDIQWNGSFWIAVGKNESDDHTFALSSDGIHWTTHANSMFAGIELAQLCAHPSTNTTLVIGDDTAVYATIYNQFSLYDRIDVSSDMTETTAVGHHGSFFLLGGGNKTKISYDGFTWSSAETISLTSISSFAWNRANEGLLRVKPGAVAVGEGANTMAYSADGIMWKGLGTPIFPVRANAVKWNGTYWAAVGLSDTTLALSGYTNTWIAISSNGLEWHAQNTNSPVLTEGRDVEWNGRQWIAVGVGEVYSMASSVDGIQWEGIALPEEYEFVGTRILWTGGYWIAIGSGLYSCLISLNGQDWTPHRYACVNSTVSSGGTMTISASSGGDTVSFLHDGQLDTSAWKSEEAVYNATTGEYEGSVQTVISGESIAGEWIEFGLESAQSVVQWIAGWTVQTELLRTAYPKQIHVAGSSDGGSTWHTLDTFQWTTASAPMPDDGTTPLYLPHALPAMDSSVTSIRFVFPRIFGGHATYVEIGELDIWTHVSSSSMDSRYTPVLLPNHVLIPTARPEWISHTPYLLLARQTPTEVYGPIHNGHHITRLVPTSGFLTSACMTDQICLVSTSTNQLLYMDESQLYAGMTWTPEWNGDALDANLDAIHGLAYNQSRILAGGNSTITYHTLNEYTPSLWTEGLTASGLFTSIRHIHSNSGTGPVLVPDCMSLSDQEVVLLVGPKYYEPHSAISFSIAFQKRIPLSNIPSLSETIINYYRGDRGPTGPTPDAFSGPMGPTGSDEVRGPTGYTGPIDPSAWSMTDSDIYTNHSTWIGTTSGWTGHAVEIDGNVRARQIHVSSLLYPYQLQSWTEVWTRISMDYSVASQARIVMDANVQDHFSIQLTQTPALIGQIISISLLIDYTDIPVDRFVCDSIYLGETTYPVLHTGGIPHLPTTVSRYMQKISILCNDTQVWKVISVGLAESAV